MQNNPTYKTLEGRVDTLEKVRLAYDELQKHIDTVGTAYLDKLNDSLKDTVFLIDLPSRVIGFISAAVAATFGYTPAECIGKSMSFLFPNHESHLAFGKKLQRTIEAGKDTLETELALTKKNGESFAAKINVTLLQNEGEIRQAFGIVRDMSDQRLLKSLLKKTIEQYKTVVEDQTEVISRFLPDGTFTFVNQAYCRFFGKSESELIGSKWHPVAHEDDRPHISAQLEKMSKDHPVIVIENRVRDAQGRVCWMQFVNRGFYGDNGCLVEIQSVGRDITLLNEKKQVIIEREKKIKEQAEDLNKVNAALEVLLERRNRQLEEFKEAIYRNFAHSVLPDMEKLRKTMKNPSHRKTVSLIAQNMEKLLSPTTTLLTSTKFGLTKMEIRIATMIRNGLASPEIAEHLNISQNTVGFHRKNLRKKLGLNRSKLNLSEYLQHPHQLPRTNR